MSSEKVAKLSLSISLGFAALIVFSSFFVTNDDIQAATFVLITVWLIPFSSTWKPTIYDGDVCWAVP